MPTLNALLSRSPLHTLFWGVVILLLLAVVASGPAHAQAIRFTPAPSTFQASACGTVLSDAQRALGFTPKPPAKVTRDAALNDRNVFQASSSAAYASALAWRVSGDERYARKAVEILMAWANQNTQFGRNDNDHTLALDLGGWFSPMLYAADQLRDYSGWNQAERQTFERFWRSQVLVHTKGYLDNHPGPGNNWTDATLRDVFAAAIAFKDQGLAEYALGRLDAMFQDNKFRTDGKGNTYFPAEVRRGEHPSDNSGKKGVTYTAAALNRFVENLELADRLTGQDGWNRTTPGGATVKGLIETYYRWNVLNAPFPWHGAPTRQKGRENMFAYAAARWPDIDPRLKAQFGGGKLVSGGEGNPSATCYASTLKGAGGAAVADTRPAPSKPAAASLPAAPSGLTLNLQ